MTDEILLKVKEFVAKGVVTDRLKQVRIKIIKLCNLGVEE